jgi:endonuclease YncB( thermonuclease family)
MAQLAFGRNVGADCYKVDGYGRNVCAVYVNGKDVGLAQIDAGLAWWFRKYAPEQLTHRRLGILRFTNPGQFPMKTRVRFAWKSTMQLHCEKMRVVLAVSRWFFTRL